jgi:hypothetical protein
MKPGASEGVKVMPKVDETVDDKDNKKKDPQAGDPPGDDPNAKKKAGSAKDPESDDSEGDDKDDDSGSLDFSDPKAAKSAVEKLRAENAKHRKKNKALEAQFGNLSERYSKMEKGFKTALGQEDDDEEVTPEKAKERILAAENKAAIAELALEHGLGKEDAEYFQFLVVKAAGALEEGEELDEEGIEELAKKAKARSAPKSTSVNGKGKKAGSDAPPPADGDADDGPSLEEFKSMSLTAKSLLYQKDPKRYETLNEATKAKAKR